MASAGNTSGIKINITGQGLADAALSRFAGWHYATDGRVQTTALFVLRASGANECFEEFKRSQTIFNAANTGQIRDLYACDRPIRETYQLLHNSGLTLQHRVENMVLTRPLRVLVKGPCVAHTATVCECPVERYIVLTPAFYVVQHKAIQSIISESRKIVHAHRNTDTLLSRLSSPDTVGDSWSESTTQTAHMKRLVKAPSLETLFEIGRRADNSNKSMIHPGACAVLLQATAIMISGYEDAGTKFRCVFFHVCRRARWRLRA